MSTISAPTASSAAKKRGSAVDSISPSRPCLVRATMPTKHPPTSGGGALPWRLITARSGAALSRGQRRTTGSRQSRKSMPNPILRGKPRHCYRLVLHKPLGHSEWF